MIGRRLYDRSNGWLPLGKGGHSPTRDKQNKENKMLKIYRVRHLEQMLALAKRTKRTMCCTPADHSRIDWHIENYKKALQVVQDS